jgi:hypothetical protein
MSFENQVYSRAVASGKKKYYFDVRKAKTGNLYLTIKEVTQGETEEKNESRRIMVFDNAIKEFGDAFIDAAGRIPAKERAKPAAEAAAV